MIDLDKTSGEREVTADKKKKTQIDVHVTDRQDYLQKLINALRVHSLSTC